MSATRSTSSSLRRRLMWTVATVAIIGAVSLVAVNVSRNQPRGPVALAIKASTSQEDAGPENSPSSETEQQSAGQAKELPGPKPAGDFHSVRYGYSISLAGTPWTRWENLAEVVPEAEWGALQGNFGRLLVIPVALNGLQPWPEAIDSALLGRLGIAYPSDQLTDFQAVEHDGATGHSFRLRREVAGVTNYYCLWTLRRGEFAILVAAWIDEGAARSAGEDSAIDELPKLLERLSFNDTMPALPSFSDLNPRQRQSHAAIWNDLGLFAFNARDFNSASQSFRSAFEFQPDDPAILMNLVNSQIESHRHRDALAELEREVPRFPNQPDLWAARAYLLAETGQTEAALDAYSSLFRGSYRAEGPFAQYVALLAKNDRLDEALAATDHFLATQESFAIRKLQASLYRQQGDNGRAIAILTALQSGRPFNAELEYDLAENYIAMDRFQDALEVSDRLLDRRYDTADAYLLRARSQFALGHMSQAKASLDAVLKREPTNRKARELLAVVQVALDEK